MPRPHLVTMTLSRSMELVAVVLLAGTLTVLAPPAAAAPTVKLLGFSSADFDILDPASLAVIGHAHYAVVKHGSGIALHGDYRYANGEYDFEHDRFETPPGALPVLTSADHYFFMANGAPQFQSIFDLKSGLASCDDFRRQPPVKETVQLAPSPDTWSGASVMIPIQDFLRRGGRGTLNTFVFNCAPSPKIFAVAVSISTAHAPSALARPNVVQVDVKPDFGWIGVLIAPFVPKLHAWLDPRHEWSFVGASFERYYRGRKILMVRQEPDAAGQAASNQGNPSATGDGRK